MKIYLYNRKKQNRRVFIYDDNDYYSFGIDRGERIAYADRRDGEYELIKPSDLTSKEKYMLFESIFCDDAISSVTRKLLYDLVAAL